MNKSMIEERSAKLFYNRNNQSVRFPKGFELEADEVIIQKQGEKLIITPKPRSWDEYFAKSHQLTHDFPDEIEDMPLQQRDKF